MLSWNSGQVTPGISTQKHGAIWACLPMFIRKSLMLQGMGNGHQYSDWQQCSLEFDKQRSQTTSHLQLHLISSPFSTSFIKTLKPLISFSEMTIHDPCNGVARVQDVRSSRAW